MCLHINLKYDRTEKKILLSTETLTEEDEVHIYKCIICKKEFVIRW